ncbi:MAG: cytochrome c oxidase subunit II [Cyanobacteriota bacterium]|nr:cytochrome c oxidase subunit II [Cyanobacteriota bacterium]
MKIPTSIITMLIGVVVTLASLWYGQNNGWMPIAASEEAPLVDGLFNTMMTIATGLFLLVEGAIVIALFRFRQQPGDNTDGPPIEGNLPLEILWTGIPVVIVVGLSIYSFEVYNTMGGLDPMASGDRGVQVAAAPGTNLTGILPEGEDSSNLMAVGIGSSPDRQGQAPEVEVNILGLQFAWIFTYPQSGVVTGELHVPTGREVKLNITAQDVLHAFWVPQFRLKQDAIPGRTVQLSFIPKIAGTYPVICAELCGSYHGAMKTQVIVHTPEDYDNWLQSQIASKDAGENTVAMLPQTASSSLSDTDRLALRTADMGVDDRTLAQLHPLHHHH